MKKKTLFTAAAAAALYIALLVLLAALERGRDTVLAANLEAGGDGIVEEGTAFGKQMQAAATGDPE